MADSNPKTAPRVSVVMPAYNHERFVAAAMDSVLTQSFPDLELIVIDDGSTDRTGEIVQAYGDPRVRYRFQDNQDAFNALNRGMAEARGEFISIINSDDVYVRNRIERLLQTHDHTGAACVFTNVIPIDDNGEALTGEQHPWIVWHERLRHFYLDRMDLYNGFLHGNFMVTTSNLFLARKLAQTVGDFCSLRYLHDYDYIFRILLAAEKDTIYLHDEKLLCYRIHGGNTLGEAAVIGREQDKQVIRKYLLRRCPADLQPYLNTGIDRLVALEHELMEVKAQLAQASPPQPAAKVGMATRIRSKLQSMSRRS